MLELLFITVVAWVVLQVQLLVVSSVHGRPTESVLAPEGHANKELFANLEEIVPLDFGKPSMMANWWSSFDLASLALPRQPMSAARFWPRLITVRGGDVRHRRYDRSRRPTTSYQHSTSHITIHLELHPPR